MIARIQILLRVVLFLAVFIITIPTHVAVAAGSTRFEATGDLGTAAILELQQAPLRVMKAAPFTLRTTPVLPVVPAVREILCNLTMPAMPMPANKPKVLRQGNIFTGTMVFTMAGAWQAEFSVPLPSGKVEHFVFVFDQVLLK